MSDKYLIYFTWSRWRIGFRRYDIRKTDLGHIFWWTLRIGPLVVRRWVTPEEIMLYPAQFVDKLRDEWEGK